MQDIKDIIDTMPTPFSTFDYAIFAIIFALLIALIVFIIVRFKRTKAKKIDIDFNDKNFAYQASIYLQNIKSPKAKELLEELTKYKYTPSPPPMSKELKERILRLLNDS